MSASPILLVPLNHMNAPAAPALKKTPLDAAKAIVEVLEGLDRDDQAIAVRFAVEVLKLALSAPSPSHPPRAHAAEGPAHVERPRGLDIKAFTEAKVPSSDQQFAAVVAYYYQFEAPEADRRESIDAATMKEAARLAGRPQVERWRMTLTNAKNAGFLNSAGDGAYKLSSVGENLVAITLPGPVKPGATPASKKSKK